jgi:hypothetical protein
LKHITEYGAIYNDPSAAATNVQAFKDLMAYAQTGKPVSMECEGETLYVCQDGSNAWAFLVPSNVDIHCKNTKLKLAPGASSWTRLLSIGKGYSLSENIRIRGDLSLDGSVPEIASNNNEHMHCAFIFNVHGLEIDELIAFNARGDNVFIGGDNETTQFSDNIVIHRLKAHTAGRKNLVWHYADRVHIGTATLDNTQGGASLFGGTPDDTDRHCLDIEPDDYTGSRRFTANIGYLSMKGSGLDAGSSIKAVDSDDFKLHVGSLNLDFVANGTVEPWIHNGGMISIGSMNVRGLNKPISPGHGAKLVVSEATLSGNVLGSGLLRLKGTSPNKPSARFGNLSIENVGHYAVQVLGGDLDIDHLQARSPSAPIVVNDSAVANQGVASIVRIGHAHTFNSGDSSVVSLVGKAGIKSCVNIGTLTVEDTRTVKPPIVYVNDTAINANLRVGKINNISGMTEMFYGY